MVLASIREIIASALSQEEQTGDLRSSFEKQIPKLRQKLLLPEKQPVDAFPYAPCPAGKASTGCVPSLLKFERDVFAFSGIHSGPQG